MLPSDIILSDREDFTVDELLAILKLSTLLEMEKQHNWAVRKLGAMLDNVPSLLILHYALRYSVPHWVEGAFRRAVCEPIKNQDPKHTELLGSDISISRSGVECE